MIKFPSLVALLKGRNLIRFETCETVIIKQMHLIATAAAVFDSIIQHLLSSVFELVYEQHMLCGLCHLRELEIITIIIVEALSTMLG